MGAIATAVRFLLADLVGDVFAKPLEPEDKLSFVGRKFHNPARFSRHQNSRLTTRLQVHLHAARHRRRPLSAGPCARCGQSLCWQVRRFPSMRDARQESIRRRTWPECAEVLEGKRARRFPRPVLARSRAEGDRSVRPKPPRRARLAGYLRLSPRQSPGLGTPAASIV